MAEKDLLFGKRLEQFLGEAGIKKKKLADLINVSPSAVGTYINEGRIPEAPILLRIARLLNKSMEELLTGEEPKKEEVQAATPFYTSEEQAYMERLVEVLRNPATKKAIQENIDTFLKVPRPAQEEEEAPFVRGKKGGTGP